MRHDSDAGARPLSIPIRQVLWWCGAVAAAVGCAASLEDQLWKAARQTDTIPAYRQFLASFPSGLWSEEAELRLQRFYEAVHALTSVHIVVDEAYTFGRGDTELDDIHLPLRATAVALLRHVPLAADSDSAGGTEGVLRLRMQGRALRQSYAPKNERNLAATGSATRQYAGASLRGAISLQTTAGTVHDRTFAGLESPPERIGSASFPTPQDAPFESAFHASFAPEICRMVGYLYGADPLIGVLEEEGAALRTAATVALGELGDSTATGPLLAVLASTANFELRQTLVVALGLIGDPRAVAPLIEVLRASFDASLRESAGVALREITGVDHGSDAAAWRGW